MYPLHLAVSNFVWKVPAKGSGTTLGLILTTKLTQILALTIVLHNSLISLGKPYLSHLL